MSPARIPLASWLSAAAAVLLSAGCRRHEAAPSQPAEAAQQPSNRIAVPEAVRRNLGIRFVKAERRRVAATLRVPGSFELLPSARREYRTPFAGRVELVAAPLQEVAAGDVLFRIGSAEWRKVQRELGELVTSASVTRTRLQSMDPLIAAHQEHEQSLEDVVKLMASRVKRLEEMRAGVGGHAQELSAAEVQLAQVKADLSEVREKDTELHATRLELQANLAAAEERFRLGVSGAAAMLGVDEAKLSAQKDGVPAWRSLAVLEARAVAAGRVDRLAVATGGWVEVGALVASTVDVQQVRFRARALQSDLWRLRSGLPSAVVPAQGGAPVEQRVLGPLALGVEADPQQRTLDLFLVPEKAPEWGRPGVAAFLEVETAGPAAGAPGSAAELAVPASCVLQDGLQKVLFRRDAKDPDVVIRMEADLGASDGRWVEVRSGLVDGDEVVLHGAYELMLASSGQATKAGHFHADGTFHPDAPKK